MEARRVFTVILFVLLAFSLLTLGRSASFISLSRHALGIGGTALIFGADLFYSSRKYGKIGIGKLKWYLKGHIAIGILGPLLVLVHAGFAFRGFAGLALMLTLTVLVSGFIGRYIYRLIPRKIEGPLQDLSELKREEENISSHLLEELGDRADLTPFLSPGGQTEERSGFWLLIKLTFRSLLTRYRFNWAVWRLMRSGWGEMRELSSLFYHRSLLERQIRFYYGAKDMLSKWKLVHIPLTVALFLTIITHVMSVFYYGRLV